MASKGVTRVLAILIMSENKWSGLHSCELPRYFHSSWALSLLAHTAEQVSQCIRWCLLQQRLWELGIEGWQTPVGQLNSSSSQRIHFELPRLIASQPPPHHHTWWNSHCWDCLLRELHGFFFCTSFSRQPPTLPKPHRCCLLLCIYVARKTLPCWPSEKHQWVKSVIQAAKPSGLTAKKGWTWF